MKTDQHQDSFIKFNCHLIKDKIVVPSEIFTPLNYWRNELWLKTLIGAYHDGIGYGNISARVPQRDRFYISGTATGGIPELDHFHYPLVERCDTAFNALWCRGLIKASSESMSHAAIYSAIPEVGAVVHIHSRKLWDKYVDALPTTDRNVQYGTPEMASEIGRLMTHSNTLEKKVIVMGGHDEGIISFGKTVEEAALAVLNLE
ncbi:MAG: class II aldolase/adducin family protein [Mariniphaga sp.]